MSEVAYWERKLIETFASKRRIDRYLFQLKGPKHRQTFLDLLNHRFELRDGVANRIPNGSRSAEDLLSLLQSHRVAETAWILADGTDEDGRELRLETAVKALVDNCFGAILICPPTPIALYKEEAVGDLWILTSHRTS